MEQIIKALDGIEAKLSAMSTKAEGELATVGRVASETKSALDNLGIEQRTLADRLLALEQKGAAPAEVVRGDDSWGEQLVKSAKYADFVSGATSKLRIEVKNTLTGGDATVAPDRKPGIVPGAMVPMTLEAFLPSTTTSSNAIEFTKEASFTNAAAETAEAGSKPESALTWSLVNVPVQTVAHWIKISRQLAADNTALAAYVNARMTYGVNLKVENQLVAGTGTTPQIGGMFIAGNYTAHGIANAALGTVLKKAVLIRKVIADSWAAGYPADGIVMNPADWAQMEIDLMTTAAGQTLFSVGEGGTPRLFGLPVIQSTAMTSGSFMAGAFGMAYMVYNREGVVIDLSDSDSDNFTKNLVTVRAERRLALATERPAAVRGGTLTPA